MSLTRFLRPAMIKLHLETREDADMLEDPECSIRYKRDLKKAVLDEICALFEENGAVGNRSKLLNDMINREKKASTALGSGVAIPHVRTMQIKQFSVAVLRSVEGIWFDAPDDEPVHVFIAMAAPPYEDSQYQKLYRSIGKAMLEYPELVQELREASDEGEMRQTLRFYLR